MQVGDKVRVSGGGLDRLCIGTVVRETASHKSWVICVDGREMYFNREPATVVTYTFASYTGDDGSTMWAEDVDESHPGLER